MTLALSGKSRRRRVLLAGSGVNAVLLAFFLGLSSQGSEPAGAATRAFSPASVNCSEDFVGGLFFATDNDPNPPGYCTNDTALAVGGSPDGNSVNVETDDSAEGDTAMGDDDLVVRFDLGTLPVGAAIAGAILKVWASSSDAPGLLKAGSASSGEADSRYGSIGPASTPANYSNANLRQDVQSAGRGLFEVNLSMFCVGPSDDCGALVDAAQLEVTLPDGSISNITKTHDGDGVYNRGETFNWTIAFEVTGGNLASSKFYRDPLPPSKFVIGQFSFDGPSDGFRCSPSGFSELTCVFEAPSSIAPGLYSVTFTVTVLAGAACGPFLNLVQDYATPSYQGPVARDAVEISCGTETATPAPTVTATETTSPTVNPTTSQTAIATQATPTPTATATSTSSPTATLTPGGSSPTATSTPTRTATPTPTSTAALKYKLRMLQLAYDGVY